MGLLGSTDKVSDFLMFYIQTARLLFAGIRKYFKLNSGQRFDVEILSFYCYSFFQPIVLIF